MARAIAEILRNYQELASIDSINPNTSDQARAAEDLLAVRSDIERALKNVSFTQEERDILGAFFLVDPEPPERSTTSGRPRGGTTQGRIAELMLDASKSQNAKNIALSRALGKIYDKLGAYLGDEYGV